MYTPEMQTDIDRQLKKHVAPGYGGISQEMWIAAPETIRARERKIIDLILKSGRAPAILRRKQMVFLPKAAHVDPTLDNAKAYRRGDLLQFNPRSPAGFSWFLNDMWSPES